MYALKYKFMYGDPQIHSVRVCFLSVVVVRVVECIGNFMPAIAICFMCMVGTGFCDICKAEICNMKY